MTFTTDPIHEVTPARLQAPGVVAHKDTDLMSKQHGTDPKPAYRDDIHEIIAGRVHRASDTNTPTDHQILGWIDDAVDGAVDRITAAVETARRLNAIEAKLNQIIDRIGLGANEETLSTTIDRIEDHVVGAAVASTRRDRLVLEAVEGPTGRVSSGPKSWDLTSDVDALDYDDALGENTDAAAARLAAAGGVLPITFSDDGRRRA